MPTIIRYADLVETVAAALQYISYYHPADYISHLARAYHRLRPRRLCRGDPRGAAGAENRLCRGARDARRRSEEHTSELQSPC